MSAFSRAIRVVILGSGFAGIYAYLGLHKRFHGKKQLEVTMVSRRDYFLFVTLLHEVATGNLMPFDIVQPIRSLPHCCLDRFIEGFAVGADLDRRMLTIDKREMYVAPHEHISPQSSRMELSYDYLISALGSETKFFGVEGASDHALTMKNLDDARAFKNRVIDTFEHADDLRSPDEQKKELCFAIVGGGPTGVELAGELADYMNNELARAFPRLKGFARIVLIQGPDRLVPQVDPWFGGRAEAILKKKGNVEFLFDKRVTKISQEGVYMGDEFLPCRNVVWTAGVQANRLDAQSEHELEYEGRNGRVKVNAFLQLPSYKNVFVAGDQAWVYDKESNRAYPMRAQFAQREGDLAAENVRRMIAGEALKEFEWRDQGFILSLGKGGALAEIYGIKLSGAFAWFLYRAAYGSKIVGARAKLRTALDWLLNFFFPRDVSKV